MKIKAFMNKEIEKVKQFIFLLFFKNCLKQKTNNNLNVVLYKIKCL